MELISDGSISNHITKKIYQFSFEFFLPKLFPNNSTINGQSYYRAEIEGKHYYVPATKTFEDTATFTFTVDGDLGTLENIDVRFSAAHTYGADLDVSLESPQGKVVQLFKDVYRGKITFFRIMCWMMMLLEVLEVSILRLMVHIAPNKV